MFSESIRNNLLLNLVGEWKLDGNTTDSWGNNNGNNNGGTLITDESQCVSGGCISFDGSNDFIAILNNSTIDFGTGDISISFFVKVDSNSLVSSIMDKGGDIGRFWVVYYESTDTIWTNCYFGTGKDFWLEGNNAVSGKWHHVVATFDKDGFEKLYIDGVLDNQIDISSAALDSWNSTNNLLFSSGTYNFFKGFIDEIQLYNATLPETAIKQNYLSGLNNLYAKGLITELEYDEKISEL
jgi:hypothetical protein